MDNPFADLIPEGGSTLPDFGNKTKNETASAAFSAANSSFLNDVIPDFSKKFVGLAETESSLGLNLFSPTGPKGPFQFAKATAEQYGLKTGGDQDERFDPNKSAQASVKYLEDLYKQFGNEKDTFTAYNFGPGALSQSKEGKRKVTEEANLYHSRILANTEKLFGGNSVTDIGELSEAKTETGNQTANNDPFADLIPATRTIEQEVAQGEANLAGFSGSPRGRPTEQQQGVVRGAFEQVQQGLLLNFGDEASAGIQAGVELAKSIADGNPIDIKEAFSRNLEGNRKRLAEFEQENPTISALAQGVGIAVPALATGGGVGLGRAGSGIARQVAEGGVLGSVAAGTAAAGEAQANRVDAFNKGAAVGFGVGGALSGAAGVISKRGIDKQVADAIPTNETLRNRAGQLYDEVESLGVTIKPKSFEELTSRLNSTAKETGFFAANHPKVSNALKEFDRFSETGVAPSLKEMDQLRRVLRSAAGSIEPDERRISSILIDDLDNYVSSLKSVDVATGNAKGAGEAFSDARLMWSRLKKSEVLDEAFEKADLQASGFENGIRAQFRSILNNKRKKRGFTDDELKAMRKVVQGGPIENNLRRLGRFSFGSGRQSNILGGSIGATAGFSAGGPAGAVIVPALGQAAKTAARNLTEGNAKFASQLVRAGNNPKSITRAYLRLPNKDPDELAGLLLNAGIRNPADQLKSFLSDLPQNNRLIVRDATSILSAVLAADTVISDE